AVVRVATAVLPQRVDALRRVGVAGVGGAGDAIVAFLRRGAAVRDRPVLAEPFDAQVGGAEVFVRVAGVGFLIAGDGSPLPRLRELLRQTGFLRRASERGK